MPTERTTEKKPRGTLVMSRRQGESVLIGDVEVFLLDIGRTTVKFAINAPKEVPIVRGGGVATEKREGEAPTPSKRRRRVVIEPA